MKNLRILFLGWGFLPDNDQEPETNCYGIAKAMANQVALSLILPKADSHLNLDNVDFTGLNSINFKEINTARSLPKVQPFAESEFIRPEIPLYGSPNIPENQRAYSPERSIIPFTATQKSFNSDNSNNAPQEATEYFDQIQWDNSSLDSKVIQYARFVTRFAANRAYDVIYASNWLTYLAGNELHLVTGKPLAIQMNTLSLDHRELNNQGWRFELEKMVIEQANHIFTSSSGIAESLEEAYPLSLNKVICLEESTLLNKINTGNTTNTNLWQDNEDREVANFIPMDQAFDWESQAHKMVQVLTESYA